MNGAPFAGLRTPPAPPELRRRVLGACREALAAAYRPHLLDRLWLSRAARLAWLAAMVALAAANLLASRGPLPDRRQPGPLPAYLQAAAEEPARGGWRTAQRPTWAESRSGPQGESEPW